MDRIKIIIGVSIKGILVNVLLTIAKALIGLLANSIAVVLDAINNLSDAISQIITIVGIKLSGKKPDKKHPYGYGRVEYITSVVLAVILIVTGLTSAKEAILKIINPEVAEYSLVSFVVIGLSVIVKFGFGKYVKKVGKEINSGSLIATGTDSYLDAVVTFTTFVAAMLNKLFGMSLEGILGVVLSILIIKSGFEVLIETLNSIIGERIDPELATGIKEMINDHEGVLGSYDLMLHNYGPVTTMGSVHIEVDDDMTAKQIHELTRHLSMDIFEHFGIILTIGIYASNTADNEYMQIKNSIQEILKKYPEVLQMHGFYVDSKTNSISFDIVLDFSPKNPQEIRDKIIEKLKNMYSNYNFDIIIDNDFSD